MKTLVARILASAAHKMWMNDATLGTYTAETAEHELNIAFHYAAELRNWFPWLDCDFDVTKRNFDRRRPDIILHRRRHNSLNFLVVEVKRSHDIEGANEDLGKIRTNWFDGNLLYRFGASVILDANQRTFNIRVLERTNPQPVLRIQNFGQFPVFERPRYKRVRRHTLRRIATAVSNGQTPEDALDAKIRHLYI